MILRKKPPRSMTMNLELNPAGITPWEPPFSHLKSFLHTLLGHTLIQRILLKLWTRVFVCYDHYACPSPLTPRAKADIPLRGKKAFMGHTQLPQSMSAPLISIHLGTQHRAGKKAGRGREGRVSCHFCLNTEL